MSVAYSFRVTLSTGDQTEQFDSNDNADSSPLTANSRASSVNEDQPGTIVTDSDETVHSSPIKSKETILSSTEQSDTVHSSPVKSDDMTSSSAEHLGDPVVAATKPASEASTPRRSRLVTIIILFYLTSVAMCFSICRKTRGCCVERCKTPYWITRKSPLPSQCDHSLMIDDSSTVYSPASIEQWTTDKEPMMRPYYSMMPKMLSDADMYMP